MGMLLEFNSNMPKHTALQKSAFSILDAMADEFVATSKSKGFCCEIPYDPDKDIAATHEELSELRHAITRSKMHEPCDKASDMQQKIGVALTCGQEEAADCIIQALKLARLVGIKNIGEAVFYKNAYNKTRPWRHGRK